MSAFIAIAHHPYDASQDDELSFQKDDRIRVTDNSDADWWVGTLESTGATGLFPSNFVSVETGEETTTATTKTVETEQNKDKAEEEEVKEEGDEEDKEEKVPEKKDSIIGMARVMEDYPSQGPGEISLHRGGIINVYEVLDDEWARGELNGKVGKYPTKYVEDIDMPGRPDFGMKTSDAGIKKEDDGGFKLAAFGVKQGGIGSLFGGGFPGLKKTNSKPVEPVESKPVATAPQVPTASVPTVPATTKPVEEPKVTESPVVEEVKPVAEPENAKKSLGRAIVLHPYDPDNEDELSLIRGEYIEILDRDVDEGWWEGKNERGETGVFPLNHVKDLGNEPISVPPPTRTRRSVNSPSTPTTPSGQLPPIPNNSRPSSINSNTPVNARPVIPTGARPVTIQPSSNTRRVSVPSVPRPSSLNSGNSSSSISKPFTPARPPPVPEQSILPVTNVDQDAASRSMDEPVAAAVIDVAEPQVVNKEEEVAVPEIPAVEEKAIEQVQPIKEKEEGEKEKVVEPVKELVENVKSEEEEQKKEDEPVVIPQVSEKSESIKSPVEEVASRSLDEPVAPVPSTEEKELVKESVEKKEVEEQQEENEKKEEAEEVKAEEEEKEEKKEEKKEEIEEPKTEEDEKEEEKKEVVEQEEEVVEEEEKPADLDTMAPTGPKLTTPSRVRIGGNRTRRAPTTPSNEPSQTEILQKELEKMPEPEKPAAAEKPSIAGKPAVSPPPKPVKPIFAKFPTPFATGEDITKHQLKPVTRRPWEVKQEQQQQQQQEAAASSTSTSTSSSNNSNNDDEAPARPTGVKNLASRFNFGGIPSGGSNDLLETKLKNHTKNEVEKVRKEFEALLQEERDKRAQLEDKVTVLMERLEALEHK